MAQRAVWTGMVSFGLVNVPVKLYTAVTPQGIKFNQINSKTGARIKQKRIDANSGQEVAYEDIVKGYEIAPDRYVTITPNELEKVQPQKTKQVVIEQFADPQEILPVAYDASYYLAPQKGGAHAYTLLAAAMAKSCKVGIGRIILRSVERLVAIRSIKGKLVLSTMVFADEVNDPDKLPEIDGTTIEVPPAEVDMATNLIGAYSREFDHASYTDEYRAEVRRMIDSKAAGEVVEAPEASTPSASVPDLMGALEASLEAIKTEKVDK